jgi:membrane-associated phospholipid phosphatase
MVPDLAIFHAINGYCGRSWVLDHLLGTLQGNNLIGGGLSLATFWALWFDPAKDQVRRREILITLLFALVLSLIANRLLSVLLPFRSRPMFNPGSGYRAPLYDEHETPGYDLENWSSFPSDNGTYYFVMVTGFWLLSRRLGIFFTLYSIVSVMLPRIYFGLHYPSDLLVGALIGIGVTLAIERERIRNLVGWRVLTLKQRAPAYFHGVMFLVTFEAGNLFLNVRGLGKNAIHLLRHYQYL